MSHVVIRTVRPYANEEAFLQAEGWTLSRKSIVLLDQPEHPEGTVVRFELKLENGARLMRAEGSVERFRAADGEFPSQLELKFRRFDAATKALIESAEALAALTEDEYEVIDDIEALSDVEASEPIRTEPLEQSDPAPDSAPGVALSSAHPSKPAAGNTQPLATQPLGSFESADSPYAPPPEATPPPPTEEQELDEAVASATQEVRSSSRPEPPLDEPDALGGSALKLDALISEALSEPPPAAPAALAMTPLPISDQIPTLLDNSAPSSSTTPFPVPPGRSEVDDLLAQPVDALEMSVSPPNQSAEPESDAPHLAERLEAEAPLDADQTDDAERPDAVETRGSGVHPRPSGKVSAPGKREELLAKLRERRLRKTRGDAQPQSGSGTSSGT